MILCCGLRVPSYFCAYIRAGIEHRAKGADNDEKDDEGKKADEREEGEKVSTSSQSRALPSHMQRSYHVIRLYNIQPPQFELELLPLNVGIGGMSMSVVGMYEMRKSISGTMTVSRGLLVALSAYSTRGAGPPRCDVVRNYIVAESDVDNATPDQLKNNKRRELVSSLLFPSFLFPLLFSHLLFSFSPQSSSYLRR